MLGQVKEQEIKLRDIGGNPKLIEFKETKISNQKESVEEFLKQQFKTPENIEFRIKSNILEKKQNGFESQKLQQYYKGIKVEHGRLNAISKNGNLSKIVGRYVNIENLSLTPSLTEEQALNFALKHINAEKYLWEDQASENILKNEQNNPNASHYPKGELVIIEKRNRLDSQPKLAYKFDIYSLKPLSRVNYFIDAITGEILLEDKILKHVEGTGHTRFSGTRTIETEQIRSQFRLRDNVRGNGIHTFNMNNGSNYGSATDLTDNDNNWTASEYNNANRDNALLDAHWGAINTYDYFFNEHGRNSIDNSGFLLRNYVNANLTGFGFSNSDNAFWDGQRMTYGIGTTFEPLVSIDIIAHEIGHGLDQFTSDLVYQNESGAIDESLSDIWGAMVEFYAAPEKQTYLLAEDIGFVIRSMSNPKTYGDPDTYQGQNWWTSSGDNGGVHTNSGVMNHWFYLLAEGSSSTDGVNDNGDTFNIAGIGKTKAAQIVYRAQTVYFNDSFLTYADARVYTLQAAEDLFGANSPEAIQTCQSWFAVGVGNNECIQNFEIVGVDHLCGTQNATYTIPNVPSGSSINWSVNYALTILSSNNSSITVKPKYTSTNGFGVITANINGVIQRKSIFVGRPSFTVPITQGMNWVTANLKYGSTNLNIESQGITNIQWQKVSGNGTMVLSYDTNNNPISATIHGPGGSTGWSFRGKVTITNSCGNKVIYFNANRAGSGGNNCPRCDADGPIPFSGATGQNENQSKIEIYPNPVDNILKVNLMNGDKGFIKIYNLQGQLMQKVGIITKQLELNTSHLPNGVYFVDINQGMTRTTQKIIVQH